MPNIASVLKAEIARIARKEGRSQIDPFKKGVAAQRADIAALKRRVQELEQTVKALTKGHARSAKELERSGQAGKQDPDGSGENGVRFRAAGMASNRRRLGLSAEDFGLLVGASGQSIYNWEQGKSKPSAKNRAAVAALRGAGKREVAKRLEQLRR